MSGAVVTLTPAGAVDATYRVAAVRTGAFTRASTYKREMSGKGVNVSAALALAGRRTSAVVVIGADDLDFATRSAHAPLLRPVTVPGATRVNTSIIDDAGLTTKVNAPTPPIPRAAWDAALAATRDELERQDAGWLVVSGTLPVIAGTGELADIAPLIAAAGELGVPVAIDSSGAALARATDAGSGVALVTPNADELAEVTGMPLRSIGDVVDAARSVVAGGVTAVYASLGADGVVVVTASTAVHAYARAVRLANTAGAGDASLAGFLVGLGAASLDDPAGLAAAAASAAAWGAHAVAQATTILPDLVQLPVATVTVDPDASVVLSEPAIPD